MLVSSDYTDKTHIVSYLGLDDVDEDMEEWDGFDHH